MAKDPRFYENRVLSSPVAVFGRKGRVELRGDALGWGFQSPLLFGKGLLGKLDLFGEGVVLAWK